MKVTDNMIFILAISLFFTGCTNEEVDKSNTPPIEEYKEIGSGETNGYKLVWEDLFNENTLDTNNWEPEIYGDGSGNAELEYYRAENISMGNEPLSGKKCLILTAKKENFEGRFFTSGRLKTAGKQEFVHGKIEASIKLPKTANGLWPAFWMLGADYKTNSWPACGEIDILEMGHSDGIKANKTERYFNGACHWGAYHYENGNAWYPNYAKASTAPYSLQDDQFHLFTLIWDEQSIKMYLDLDKHPDTKPYYELTISETSTNDSPGNYFHKKHFILLNLAVGGRFTGILDPTKINALDNGEAKMYIDFVKVYQKGKNN